MATLTDGYPPTEASPGVFDPPPTATMHTGTHVFYLWDVAEGYVFKIQRGRQDSLGLYDQASTIQGASLVRWLAALAVGYRDGGDEPMPKFQHGLPQGD